MAAQTLIMNLNVLMMSRLGDGIVAAVGSSYAVLNVVSLILGIVSSGSTLLAAQYIGAGQSIETTRIIVESVRLNFLVSGAISLFLFLFPGLFLHFVNVPHEIWTSARMFFRWMNLLNVIQSFMMLATGILRSLGKTKVVMVLTASGVIFTVLLNAVVIFGLLGAPKLGLKGIVLSNSVVSIIGGGAVWFYFMKSLPSPVPKHAWFRSWHHVRQIIRVGVPSAGEFGSYQLTQFLIAAMVGTAGTLAISVRQYATSIESISFLFGFGVAQGVSILVGHRVGRQDSADARRISFNGAWLGVIGMSVLSMLLFYFARPFISLFSHSHEVITTGAIVIKIIAAAGPAKGLNMIVGGALRGAGDNRWLMWNSGIFVWVSVFSGYLLAFPMHFGLYGIWWGMVIDEWVRALIVLRRLIGNEWMGKSYVPNMTADADMAAVQ